MRQQHSRSWQRSAASCRDKRVIRTASAAPVAVVIRPLCHLYRIDQIVRERGYYHCHSRWAAAVAANVVCAIGLICVAFIELIVVDDLRAAVRIADVSKRRDREAALRRGKILKQAVAQKQAEILGKVLRKRLLLRGQMKNGIGKIRFAAIGQCVNTHRHFTKLCDLLAVFIENGFLYLVPFIRVGLVIQFPDTGAQKLLHVFQRDGGNVRISVRTVL